MDRYNGCFKVAHKHFSLFLTGPWWFMTMLEGGQLLSPAGHDPFNLVVEGFGMDPLAYIQICQNSG